MKKKNKAFILFFASPAFQSSFDPANPKCFRLVLDAYKKFFAEYGHQRNDELFTECYELIVGAFGYQVARLRKTKFTTIGNPVENYFKDLATRRLFGQPDYASPGDRTGLRRKDRKELEDRTAKAERRLQEQELELAACQSKIKSLEEQLRNKEEQIVGKVSDYKESEEYKQALAENNCFFTYLLDKIKLIYNNYVEYCGKNNFKPVPFQEFKGQVWGDE